MYEVKNGIAFAKAPKGEQPFVLRLYDEEDDESDESEDDDPMEQDGPLSPLKPTIIAFLIPSFFFRAFFIVRLRRQRL